MINIKSLMLINIIFMVKMQPCFIVAVYNNTGL